MVRIFFIISIFFYPAYLSSLKYGCPSPAGGWFSLFLRKLVKIRTMIVNDHCPDLYKLPEKEREPAAGRTRTAVLQGREIGRIEKN